MANATEATSDKDLIEDVRAALRAWMTRRIDEPLAETDIHVYARLAEGKDTVKLLEEDIIILAKVFRDATSPRKTVDAIAQVLLAKLIESFRSFIYSDKAVVDLNLLSDIFHHYEHDVLTRFELLSRMLVS